MVDEGFSGINIKLYSAMPIVGGEQGAGIILAAVNAVCIGRQGVNL